MLSLPRKIRRVLFWVGGNLLLFALTWVFIAVVGEVWLRLQWPFPRDSWSRHFVPKVGYMIQPNAESRQATYPPWPEKPPANGPAPSTRSPCEKRIFCGFTRRRFEGGTSD